MPISVGVAKPGYIGSVGVASPGQITSVGNNYGYQAPTTAPIQGGPSPQMTYAPGGGGVVAGARTPVAPAGPSSQQIYAQQQAQAAAQAAAQRAAQQGAINQIYDQVDQSLAQSQGAIQRQTDLARQGIQQQYGAGQQSLRSGYDLGRKNLQTAMNRVGENQNLSLRDLGQSIRNAFDAANVYLGTRGAGDSSAAGMYSFALGKMQDRGRSDVMRQAGQQYGDIDLKMAEVENNFQNSIRDLDVWRNTQLNQVASQFIAQQDQLRREMANASVERQRALANLGAQLANDALGRVRALEQGANQYLERLNLDRTQAQQALATGGRLGATNYSPTALERPNLPLGLQNNPQTGANQVNPLLPVRPRDEEQLPVGV